MCGVCVEYGESLRSKGDARTDSRSSLLPSCCCMKTAWGQKIYESEGSASVGLIELYHRIGRGTKAEIAVTQRTSSSSSAVTTPLQQHKWLALRRLHTCLPCVEGSLLRVEQKGVLHIVNQKEACETIVTGFFENYVRTFHPGSRLRVPP